MGNLQCGSRLARECLSDTDPRYDPDGSSNLVDQSPTYAAYAGFWAPMNYSYITDTNVAGGTKREPEPYNLTSGSGWPYTRDAFTGYRNVTIDGSRFISQVLLFYPPAPAEFCDQPVPEGMVNVVGTDKKNPTNTSAICGINGNVVYMESFGVSSYERNAETIFIWSGMGPVYGGYAGPSSPGSKVYATPVGSDALFTYSSFNVPGTAVTFSNTETFLKQGGTIGGGFGSGQSATQGGKSTSYKAFVYEMDMNDQSQFLDMVANAYVQFNIVEAEIPSWVKDGLPMPECLAEDYGGCPTEETYCDDSTGIDPNCTESPYQEPSTSMNPGAIAGFCILAIVVTMAVGYFFHTRSLKKQQKRLRKDFATQVAKRVDLKGSVSQLNPSDLAAEFKRIDKSVKSGSSDGFIDRDELWAFISSGKAGVMSERDFNALFDAMDVKGRGKVNFVEFAAFMSSCAEEIREVNQDEMKKEGQMRQLGVDVH